MATVWVNEGKRCRLHRGTPELERRIRTLNRLDNWHGLLAFLEDAFWISAAISGCYLVSLWLYPIALVLIGSRMRALATILHESAHGVLAANRSWNMVLGTVLSAYPIFQTHQSYKRTHVATHHPQLGNPESDPDLRYFIEQGVYEEKTDWERWLSLVILPALGSRTISFVRYLVVNRLMKHENSAGRLRPRAMKKMRRDKAAFLVFWVVVMSIVTWNNLILAFLAFWVLPYLTSFQIFSWYIELAEHTPLVRDHDMSLYMSRNRKSRGLEKFLTGMHGETYHLDHHLDPRTPFWNLKKAHRIRMQDSEYAALDAKAGGLFTRGPEGQESAITCIMRMLPITEPESTA